MIVYLQELAMFFESIIIAWCLFIESIRSKKKKRAISLQIIICALLRSHVLLD